MSERVIRYPIGIQTFSEIRNGGYLYVDKTALVYKLVKQYKYVFLSRPRRFGKSLLTSTLDAYFGGQQELFRGLAMEQLEQDWEQHPVLHFSLSSAKMGTVDDLFLQLNLQLRWLEKNNDIDNSSIGSPGARMQADAIELYQKTGHKVAILIDEYDAPLLTVLHDYERLEPMRTALQSFYAPLKDLDPYVCFVFITGITKFSQLSIFSQINNLMKISMLPEYSALCGITQEELEANFKDGIDKLSVRYGTKENVMDRLRRMYDGYHFSEEGPGVYNPFSLLSAMETRKIANYWFSTGTPSFLINQIRHFNTDITQIDGSHALATEFDAPTEDMHSILPLFYQSGYLTIKDYDPVFEDYTLGYPNEEVKVGLTQMFIPFYVSPDINKTNTACRMICKALMEDDIDAALTAAQSFFSSIPYQEGTLKDAPTCEGHFTAMLYVMFSFLSLYVWSQVRVAKGRMDILVKTQSAIYVMELKLDGTVDEALRQIDDKGYAIPWQSDGRRVVKVGINFSSTERTIKNWKAKK